MSELFNYFSRLLGLSEDIGMVLLSDRLLAFRGSDPKTIIELPLVYTPPVPPMPPERLPDEVRDGLTTRVHLGEFQSAQPIFVRGEEVDHEAAETCFREAIRLLTTPKSRFVKPRVVCCMPWEQMWIRKRALLDAIERAGARRVYLAQSAMVSAIGLDLEILHGKVYGILQVESDWSVFAVISYADQLAHRFIPIGKQDIPDPSAPSPWRERLLNEIASALSELRPPQMQKLSESGIYCLADERARGWADAMGELITIQCHAPEWPERVHPSAVGLHKYIEQLDTWKQVMQSNA